MNVTKKHLFVREHFESALIQKNMREFHRGYFFNNISFFGRPVTICCMNQIICNVFTATSVIFKILIGFRKIESFNYYKLFLQLMMFCLFKYFHFKDIDIKSINSIKIYKIIPIATKPLFLRYQKLIESVAF